MNVCIFLRISVVVETVLTIKYNFPGTPGPQLAAAFTCLIDHSNKVKTLHYQIVVTKIHWMIAKLYSNYVDDENISSRLRWYLFYNHFVGLLTGNSAEYNMSNNNKFVKLRRFMTIRKISQRIKKFKRICETI